MTEYRAAAQKCFVIVGVLFVFGLSACDAIGTPNPEATPSIEPVGSPSQPSAPPGSTLSPGATLDPDSTLPPAATLLPGYPAPTQASPPADPPDGYPAPATLPSSGELPAPPPLSPDETATPLPGAGGQLPTDPAVGGGKRPAAGSPQPLPAPVVLNSAGGSPVALGATVNHTVADGEWMLQIARCYGASFEAVRQANPSLAPDFIYPGWTVVVPNVGSEGTVYGPPCVLRHTVQQVETWESLAVLYGTTAAILQRANPGPLTVGRQIVVPVSGVQQLVEPPPITQNLMFIREGDLAVWRESDGRVEVIKDPGALLLDISTNDSGRYVLGRQTRDGGATEEYVLVDTLIRTVTLLETGLQPQVAPRDDYERMVVSFDGSWAAYLVDESSGYRLTTVRTDDPGTLMTFSGLPVLDASTGGRPPQLFPGWDDDRFLFLDRAGISEWPYALDAPERVIAGISGDPPEPAALFFAVSWSPSGRYLLAAGLAYIEGGFFSIIDTQTGAIQNVPESDFHALGPALAWSPSSELLVVQPTQAGALGPEVTTYIVRYTGNALVLSEVTRSVLPTLALPSAVPPEIGYGLSMPLVQPFTGPFGLTIHGSPQEAGLWLGQAGTPALRRAAEVPRAGYARRWTADLSGVLTFSGAPDAPENVVYVRPDEPMFSLSDWLGDDISDFFWLAPR